MFKYWGYRWSSIQVIFRRSVGIRCNVKAVHVTSTEVNINFVNGLDHITDLNYTHTLCVDLLPQRVWSTAPSCESVRDLQLKLRQEEQQIMDGKNLNNRIGRKRSRESRRQEICYPRRPSQIPSQPSSTDNDSPPRYLVASNGMRIRDFKMNIPGLTPPFDSPVFLPRRRPPESPPEPPSADNDSPPRYLVASNGMRIRDFKMNIPGLTPPFDSPVFLPRQRPPETPPEPSSEDNDSPPRYLVASNGMRIRDFKMNIPGLTPPFDSPVFLPRRPPPESPPESPSADNDSPPRYLVASNGMRIRDFKMNIPGLTPPFDSPVFLPRRPPPESPPESPSADNDSPPRYLVASNGMRIRDFKMNIPGLTPPFDSPVFLPGRRPPQISSAAPRPSASPSPHSSNEHNLSHMRRESEIPVPQPNTPREVEPYLQGPTAELNEAKDESRDQHLCAGELNIVQPISVQGQEPSQERHEKHQEHLQQEEHHEEYEGGTGASPGELLEDQTDANIEEMNLRYDHFLAFKFKDGTNIHLFPKHPEINRTRMLIQSRTKVIPYVVISHKGIRTCDCPHGKQLMLQVYLLASIDRKWTNKCAHEKIVEKIESECLEIDQCRYETKEIDHDFNTLIFSDAQLTETFPYFEVPSVWLEASNVTLKLVIGDKPSKPFGLVRTISKLRKDIIHSEEKDKTSDDQDPYDRQLNCLSCVRQL
ncbi:hypothetical protein AAMO2058_000972800 [Amorphochlora amoebiformis]